MSYNFFQDVLDEGKVIPQAQPAYVPSVIKDQSLYNAQNAVQSSITDEEKQYLKSQWFSDDEIMQIGQQQAPTPTPKQDQGFFSGALEKTDPFLQLSLYKENPIFIIAVPLFIGVMGLLFWIVIFTAGKKILPWISSIFIFLGVILRSLISIISAHWRAILITIWWLLGIPLFLFAFDAYSIPLSIIIAGGVIAYAIKSLNDKK